MTLDMSQFYQVFFEEAREHLENMESLLLALDVDNPSLDDLNAIFRAAHSIKGGSGTFGFTDMTEVTHVLETLLDRLRKSELGLTSEMVDAFLAAGDVLKVQLEHHQGGPEADPASIEDVCARLNALATGDASPAEASAPPPASTAPAQATTASGRWHLECALSPELAADPKRIDNLLAALAELASVELQHRPEPTDARLIATLATQRSEAELRDALDFYAASDEIALRPASAPAEATGYGFFEEVTPAPAEESGYGFFEEVTPQGAAPAEETGYGFFDEAPGTPATQAPASAQEDAGFGFFDEAPGTPAAAETGGEGYGFFDQAPGTPVPGTAAAAEAKAAPAPTAPKPAAAPAAKPAAAAAKREAAPAAAASAESSIRVSVEKVDQLINLVGELVITQAMLAQSAQILDPVEAEKLLSGIELLSRNTRDLQEAVMSIRMLPMSMVFNRFPRVVRDLAGKLNKQVELKTVGENTELDKSLIEKITDPLTHLVRNSLDHGIETPEKRIAAGKDAKGTITLKASHQGGNIVIEVIDDGAGLNREKILDKAKERGLPVHDTMSDHDVWQLIFAPGFSTADQITDVSGRGVGMDVVKRNIEGLGGKVELASLTGHGTRTIISLPLTLAILDGMSVGVGGDTYIVPLTLVVESLQPRAEDIRTIAGEGRVVSIRGEYLPLIPLGEVFNLPDAISDPTQGILMVIEAEGSRAALFVDELLGQHQVVIKSLETNYRKVVGISGATIMGDGRVALILDISAVTRLGLQINRRKYGKPQLGLAA